MSHKRDFLSPQQEIFFKEYVKTHSSTKAYLAAYPNAAKWKKSSLDCEASKLLNSPKILQRIREINEKSMQGLVLNKQKILQELVRQYEEASKNGTAERTNSVQVLKILAQITKLLGGDNVTVNVQNNVAVGQVTDYLDL